MSEVMIAAISLDCKNKQQLEHLCHFKRNQCHAEKVNLTMINQSIIKCIKHTGRQDFFLPTNVLSIFKNDQKRVV